MKKHIAISGKLGQHKLPTDGRCNHVEWVGEYVDGGEIYFKIHLACKWKETSTTVYYKWLY